MKKFSFLAIVLFSLTLIIGCASSPDDEQDELNYVALGASDAVGIGAIPLTNGYVFRIRDALNERGKDVDLLNLGIPTADIGAIENVARTALIAGVQKDLVTLWTGPNDVVGGNDPEDFEDSLETILEHLREETSAFIVMMNIPDLTQIPRFRERPDADVNPERIQAFNTAIQRQAEVFNVPVVDLFADMPGDELVSNIDGFHPNNRGHERIAQLFLQIILPEFNL